MNKTEEILNQILHHELLEDENDNESNNLCECAPICHSNVVSEKNLKKVQQSTLRTLKEYLSKTYGPMGSYTSIISGSDQTCIMADYSKDGLKVLKHIIFDRPIELSLQTELRDICQHVEKKVGDGTTSAVILSSLIYDELLDIMKQYKLPPRKLVKTFKEIVDLCEKNILKNAKAIDYDDIYNICMISTNGNESISNMVTSVYKEYGTNINIDVSISNDQDTKIKEYDGLTIEQGYSDPAYINNLMKGSAEIYNAKVYCFQDPVDTPEMYSFFEKIIYDNIIVPCNEEDAEKLVPTVILAPKLGRDGSGMLDRLVQNLYKFDAQKMTERKPPILIITNYLGTDEGIALDIARLCNCRYIKKYIDPDIQKKDQEAGVAPTIDTIHEFAGSAELVSADMDKTKFINPTGIVENPESLNSLIAFLEAEIRNAKGSNADDLDIGRLKKRLRSLQCNIVEFMVGGITISDRDSLKDLVEDATKNCASASEYGVGYAANFEGLRAIYKLYLEKYFNSKDSCEKAVAEAIFRAYYNAIKILYSTVVSEDNADKYIIRSLDEGAPFDVAELFELENNAKPSEKVLCSIRTDVEILDAISKIITMMVTSNQCLLQSPNINIYER